MGGINTVCDSSVVSMLSRALRDALLALYVRLLNGLHLMANICAFAIQAAAIALNNIILCQKALQVM